MIIQFGPWTADVDVAATNSRYRKRVQGGTEDCACHECRNFALLRSQAYPEEVQGLLRHVGVDPDKETEVHYYGRLPSGSHLYRGWFQIIGHLNYGPAAWVKTTDGKWERHFHRVSPTFEFGLHEKSNAPDCPSDFANVPYIEVDFYVDLPWLVNLPEPNRVAECT